MNIKTLKNDTVETVSFLVKALFFVVRKGNGANLLI